MTRLLDGVESATDHLAAGAMFTTMAIVGAEVIWRYFLNAPLAWAYDVLTMYVVPAIFFFGLPGSYSRNAHIAVDILVQRLRPLPLAVTTVLVRVGGIALFASIFWFSAVFAIEAFEAGDTVSGTFKLYVWPSASLVPFGCGLVLLRMLMQLPMDLARAARGGDPRTVEQERGFIE